MKNVFENAKFGDRFITRDGHKALYITKDSDIHKLCIENGYVLYYNGDGTYNCFNEFDDYDIVAELNEPIDENELDMIAEKNNPYEMIGLYETYYADKFHLIFNEGFKFGYRKAKGM